MPKRLPPNRRWNAEHAAVLRRMRDNGYSLGEIVLLHPAGLTENAYRTRIAEMGLAFEREDITKQTQVNIEMARFRRVRAWGRLQEELERAIDEIAAAREGEPYQVVRKGKGGEEFDVEITTGLTLQDKVQMIRMLKDLATMDGNFATSIKTPEETQAEVDHQRYAESFMRVMSVAMASANLSEEQKRLATEAVVRELEAGGGGEDDGGMGSRGSAAIEGALVDREPMADAGGAGA